MFEEVKKVAVENTTEEQKLWIVREIDSYETMERHSCLMSSFYSVKSKFIRSLHSVMR